MMTNVVIALAAAVSLASADVEDRVSQIRKWYAAIDEGQPVSMKTYELEVADDLFTGKATVRHYADGLASVTVDYTAGDHGGGTDHYYFRNGDLFFVYEVTDSWQFAPGGTTEDPKTIDTRTERRFYYDAGSCVRQLERTVTGPEGDKLAVRLSEMEQQEVEPDGSATMHGDRAKALLNAESAGEITAIYFEPGC